MFGRFPRGSELSSPRDAQLSPSRIFPMLPRTLARSLSKAPPAKACATCMCNCGRRFTPNVVQTPQRRHKAAPASSAHPDVFNEERRKGRRRAVTAKERKERRVQEESEHDWHLTNIERAEQKGLITASGTTLIDFLNEFAALCKSSGYRRPGASPVDLAQLRKILDELNINEADCNWMAYCLLSSPKEDDLVYGKKLIYALSHAGSEIATVRIMKQALVESKHKPAKLKATEIQASRKHLKQIAEKGENYRAMVLEGKVEYELGNHNATIKLWTDAMEAAVANAQDKAEKEARGEYRTGALKVVGSEHDDLETPWIELSSLHWIRREWAKAKWAINIGCEMDDPTSHYMAASIQKQTDASGELFITSTWLYHMTKAAASGHPKAAHELGNFYAHSLWPYVEDEPPDEVKPTPFDRYPGENAAASKRGSDLGQTVRTILGLQTRRREEPSETIFKSATFPTDPVGRMRLAFEWLKIAIGRTYAPSSLLAARLHLEKTLWASASTPRAALDMTDDRYRYASKADYIAGKPIEKGDKTSGAETQEGDEQQEQDEEDEQIPNPFYDPQAAYLCIRRVFHAKAAQDARAEMLAVVARQRKSGRRVDAQDVEEIALTEHGIDSFKQFTNRRTELSPEVKVFLRFAEVREMYSDDRRGMLEDDTGVEVVDVFEAAKDICEEMGWDVYDQEGVLLYRHGMVAQGKPGAAAAAAGSGR